MFFSIVFGVACGGLIISILGFINPLWIGADDKEIIYESLKGWLIVISIVIFFYDKDSFSLLAFFVSCIIGISLNFIKVEIP
ncbi:hypothetical protein MNB_SV-12-1361 [hydrothermal vent metagenome]|uniref:Uncharacterized protein n=1 Tax=hydrothermal vent metagenome TaxID=652676 RepID=A0A1W1CL69_9ZZZZ